MVWWYNIFLFLKPFLFQLTPYLLMIFLDKFYLVLCFIKINNIFVHVKIGKIELFSKTKIAITFLIIQNLRYQVSGHNLWSLASL